MTQATKKETVRTFIALPLPDNLIAALQTLQRQLRSQLENSAVGWILPDQMHVTLKFLGKVSSAAIPDLVLALERASAGRKPFLLNVAGVGCFPDGRKPRIIWAGIQGEVESLLDWQRRLDQETSPFSEKNEDRPFHAHVTIGRVKRQHESATRHLGKIIQAESAEPLGDWMVQQVDLMSSEPSSQGSCYTKLKEVFLTSG